MPEQIESFFSPKFHNFFTIDVLNDMFVCFSGKLVLSLFRIFSFTIREKQTGQDY